MIWTFSVKSGNSFRLNMSYMLRACAMNERSSHVLPRPSCNRTNKNPQMGSITDCACICVCCITTGNVHAYMHKANLRKTWKNWDDNISQFPYRYFLIIILSAVYIALSPDSLRVDPQKLQTLTSFSYIFRLVGVKTIQRLFPPVPPLFAFRHEWDHFNFCELTKIYLKMSIKNLT